MIELKITLIAMLMGSLLLAVYCSRPGFTVSRLMHGSYEMMIALASSISKKRWYGLPKQPKI
jgi:hypothetical protein